jgi:hypothetical protein
MSEGRGRSEWQQTASLLAMYFNAHRNPKDSPLNPKDFDPYAPKPPKVKVGINALRDLFVRKHK